MELFFSLSLMMAVAIASGLVGAFALMKKMTLASDAISHVALPGLGIALLLKINPIIGGAAALLLGVLIIWVIETKANISTETVIGVIFSTALALGSLITPREDLIEALLGGGAVAPWQWALGVIASAAVIAFVIFQKEKLTLSLVSEDLAAVSGVPVSRMNLYFLLIFGLNVILGLQFLGVLLMGSLIIVPAAFARNLGHSLNGTLAISLVASISSVLLGSIVSKGYGLALGPIIILIAAALFFISFFFSRRQ